MDRMFESAYKSTVKPKTIDNHVLIDEYNLISKNRYYASHDDDIRNEIRKSIIGKVDANADIETEVENRFHELEVKRCLHIQSIIEELDMHEIDFDNNGKSKPLTRDEFNKRFNYQNEMDVRREHLSRYYERQFISCVVSSTQTATLSKPDFKRLANVVHEFNKLKFEYYTITDEMYDAIIEQLIIADVMLTTEPSIEGFKYTPSKYVNRLLQLFITQYRQYVNDHELQHQIDYIIKHANSLFRK